MHAPAACFGVSGDGTGKRRRLLSEGEKARQVLARMLYDPPDSLRLDEPSNHLEHVSASSHDAPGMRGG